MAKIPLSSTEVEEFRRQAHLDLLLEYVLEAKNTATSSPSALFDFIALEENSKEPIRVLPHQKLFFDFVMAHPRCVIFQPPGTSKTFNTAILTLLFLGQDATARGAIVSDTQMQAEKPLAMVRDYITGSDELHLAFPRLRPTMRGAEKWTQSAITVDRPMGIRDASLVALGVGGALAGSRLSWVVVDDILSIDNTETEDQREKVIKFFDMVVLSRADFRNGRIVVTNTAHHDRDLQHYLMRSKKWPTIRMEVTGDIHIYNTTWDSESIRPSRIRPLTTNGPYRLVQHDPDPLETKSLWPTKFTPEIVAQLRRDHSEKRFAQLYLQRCVDEDSQRCKSAWVESCKERGKGIKLLSQYQGPNYVATGVDLAIGQGEEHDLTAMVTVEFLANGDRRLLDVESGRWDVSQIVDKCFEKSDRFKSTLRVENNAAQDYLLQILRKTNKSIRLVPHTTGRNKSHPEYGVEGVFIEFRNKAWIIPCDERGGCHAEVSELLAECLSYQPSRHTGDRLMALWFAVEQGRHVGSYKALGDGKMGYGGLMAR